MTFDQIAVPGIPHSTRLTLLPTLNLPTHLHSFFYFCVGLLLLLLLMRTLLAIGCDLQMLFPDPDRLKISP